MSLAHNDKEESLVVRCVREHQGKWKYSHFERYMYWDEDKGWNLTHGKAVYYADFERCAVILGYVKNKEDVYKEMVVAEVEKHTNPTVPEYHLWEEKEPIMVGMKLTVTNSFDTPMLVKEIIACNGDNETQYLLAEESTNVHHLFYREYLRSLVKDPREVFCKKMLGVVQSSHPDFSQDDTWDIEELAGWCWDELKGDNIVK